MKLYHLFLLLFLLQTMIQTQTVSSNNCIAVTFDDLPVVHSNDNADLRDITTKLLAIIRHHAIPAVGFVNTGKLEVNGVLDTERVTLLQQWLNNGLELGNHTRTHYSFHQISVDSFFTDIIAGEMPLRKIMEQYGEHLRYFRHPYLQTGRSRVLRDSLQRFLMTRDYTIAPVTVDNSDWIFAHAYEISIEKGDSTLAQRIGEAYVEYMIEKIKYFETCSIALFNRNIKHVLLVHANRLNSRYFDRVASRIETAGYRFATLEEVLADPAYKSPDDYFGGAGMSWLHRWGKSMGMKRELFLQEPACPQFIMEIAGIKYE